MVGNNETETGVNHLKYKKRQNRRTGSPLSGLSDPEVRRGASGEIGCRGGLQSELCSQPISALPLAEFPRDFSHHHHHRLSGKGLALLIEPAPPAPRLPGAARFPSALRRESHTAPPGP